MSLSPEYRTENAKFVILPIEYEKALTYGIGASKRSSEIIKASEHLGYYDDQFDVEPYEQGINLLELLSLNEVEPEEMVTRVAKTVSQQKDKFLIGLGGDHAITIGIVKGLEEQNHFCWKEARHSSIRYPEKLHGNFWDTKNFKKFFSESVGILPTIL